MRDAGPQSCEVGGTRRNRDLARRRECQAIDFGFVLEAFLRLTGAIVLETLAFSIWNIGTRSPAAVLRDARARSRDRAAIAALVLRISIGTIFLLAGTILLVPAVANLETDFAGMEVFTLLVALGLEHLIGPDVRAFAQSRKAAP